MQSTRTGEISQMKLTADIRKLILSEAQRRYDKARPIRMPEKELTSRGASEYFGAYSERQKLVREQQLARSDYITNLRYLLGTFSTVGQLEDEWPEVMVMLEGITLNPRQFELVI